MNSSDSITFTKDDYERFVKTRAFITNQVYRSEGQSFYEAMRSDESDFTKTADGKGALEVIIAYGEKDG